MSAISSIASVLGISDTAKPVTAAIGRIDSKTSLEDADSLVAFQYFPENITDTRSPNWASREIPGGSHPIYTFISGGPRVVSFSAVFTQDENPEPSGIAGFFTGANAISLGSIFGGKRKDTADIAAALRMLRAFTYPKYNENVVSPPDLCVIYLPNSGIIGQPNFPDSIVGAMTQCDITYESFHRNGEARIAVVSLAFAEVIQLGDNWGFVGSETNFDFAMSESRKYERTVIGGPIDSRRSGDFAGLGGGQGLPSPTFA